MNISSLISESITSEESSHYSSTPCNMALKLALQIKQAALQSRAHELDLCVKQIGCDNKLGHSVAKATQIFLEGTIVSVSWIPNSHDFFGSLLFLNGQWAIAFSSTPTVSPEGLSLNINDLAAKRGKVDELFTLTPSPPNVALHAIFDGCETLTTDYEIETSKV